MIRKIRKIIFIVVLLMLGMIVVKGATIDRNLTCDATKQVFDKFTTKEKKAFENSVCTISCSEELFYGYDPIKNVLAGRGFSYPLYLSGQKQCNAKYKYASYYSRIQNLVNLRDGTSNPTFKQDYINQINNLLLEKQECDEYYKKDEAGEYKINADVTFEVQNSSKTEIVDYVYYETNELEPVYEESAVPYRGCELQNGTSNCIYTTRVVSEWDSIDRNDGVYTVGERYIEAYTGNIKKTSSDPNDCKICNAYVVSFYEKTKPEAGVVGDKGYTLKIVAKNVGGNITPTDDVWNLTINCWYTVENIIFPQSGDVNYTKYGEFGFMYRLIDLKNPFPKRDPGDNWFGKIDFIREDTRSNIMYEINLTRGAIKTVREDNELHPNSYSIFDYDINGRNSFIEKYISIITRKYSGD